MAGEQFMAHGKRIEYPFIVRRPDRVQVIFEAPPACAYGILILHSSGNHWNAYTLVDSKMADWLAKDEYAATVINYIAPAGRPVTWMGPTQTGKLSIPMQVLPAEAGGDYWVGAKLHGDPTNIDSMIDQLFVLHNDIFDLILK